MTTSQKILPFPDNFIKERSSQIFSKVSSRIRFRSTSLRSQKAIQKVKDALNASQGIIKSQFNQRVGSVLIFFDSAKIKAESILQKIQKVLPTSVNDVQKALKTLPSKVKDLQQALPKNSEELKDTLKSFDTFLTSKRGKSLTKKALLATGIATVATLAFSKKSHAFMGLLMVKYLALHCYQNRKSLLK